MTQPSYLDGISINNSRLIRNNKRISDIEEFIYWQFLSELPDEDLAPIHLRIKNRVEEHISKQDNAPLFIKNRVEKRNKK